MLFLFIGGLFRLDAKSTMSLIKVILDRTTFLRKFQCFWMVCILSKECCRRLQSTAKNLFDIRPTLQPILQSPCHRLSPHHL